MKNSLENEAKVSLISLNGFTLSEAKQMRTDFHNSNVIKPLLTTVWFSKEMISNMVALLQAEFNSGLPVDGVRIYYGQNKLRQNTVILVSTYENGTNAQNKKIHQDYFEHDANSPLFTNSNHYSLNGEICVDNSCGGGARLYQLNKNYNEDRDCDRDQKHYVSMQYATEMVWNFGTGLINTECEWFDKSMFESFLTGRFNGIRIYFGKRPNTDVLYPGMDGFVIVTTENYKSGNIEIPRRDYFDCDERQFHDGQDNGEQCHPNCDGTIL